MANHKSAIKRARQSEERRLRNRASKTQVKNVVKRVRLAVAGGAAAPKELDLAKSVIAKATKKGALHKRTAARKISRLSRLMNKKSA
ncbi:MAG: 30S ribosomal protein S20 [Desulfobacterales bacterium]|nr:30S ribosomal protein S20 [Desulfobacterales bacterium]